jgi:hypothetical protein
MSKKLPNLHKAENPEQYAKLANEGILLGYPVKINGSDKRPDNGINYHSTIKYFDPSKDHPHAIHELAQHLPLNPPDAKNTQIKFDKFKDRMGNDVHVITLHGNSADKIKEHNGKFAGMGFPSTFEWTPHVSVDKNTWDKVRSSGAKTAYEAGIEFGSAHLKKGPKVLKNYHHEADTTDPKVPDQGDFTAKMNAPTTKKSEETLGQKPLMKPYVSEAQRRWAHTPSGKEALGGNAGVHEWDEATKGKKLPEKVGKSESIEKSFKGAATAGLMSLSTLASHPAQADHRHVNAYLNSMKNIPGLKVETKTSPTASYGKISIGKFHVHTNAMLGGKSPISNHEVTLSGPDKKAWTRQDAQDYNNAKYIHQHLSEQMPKLMDMTGPIKKSEIAIKMLIKTDKFLFTKYGKALGLSSYVLENYIEDNKDLQKMLEENK